MTDDVVQAARGYGVGYRRDSRSRHGCGPHCTGFAIRATPGNVGVFQALYALTATAFGMDSNEAIAVAFLIQTQQIIPITLIGVAMAPEFIFKRKQVVRAEDRGLDLHSRTENPAASS